MFYPGGFDGNLPAFWKLARVNKSSCEARMLLGVSDKAKVSRYLGVAGSCEQILDEPQYRYSFSGNCDREGIYPQALRPCDVRHTYIQGKLKVKLERR